MLWRHNGAMPSIQIKDVPTPVHATLRRRAAAAGQSLQEYLLERLTEDAQTPTLDTNATLTQTVTINSDGTTTANPTPATPTSITLRLLLSGTSAAPWSWRRSSRGWW